jgi:ABC-type phosphate transport system substrate-binding protein
VAAAALLAVALVAPVFAGPAAWADTVVNGEGSNFDLTAMQQWIVSFPNVNYQGIGSPDGLNQFYPPQGPEAAQPIHFVETDIPYTPGQLSTHAQYPLGPLSAGGVWSYVPIAAGGIALMYHLHDANGQPVGTLRLNQVAIADIMTFRITSWNDPYLAALNPGIALPNEKIHLVVDSTASGQTYLLSQYFLANPATAAVYTGYTHDSAPQDNWGPLESTPQGPLVGPCSPACIAEAGPSAQAEYVSQASSEGALAYVPTAYAVSDSEPVAAVQNFAGKFTLPSHDDVTAALDSATNPNGSGVFDGFEQIDWNAPASTAYPISTYSYMLVWLNPSKVPGLTQGAADAVAAFGEWAITTGQKNAYNIGYAPVSNVLIRFGLATYESIPGAPQGIAIPCIPGSEGNTCNQDPPGPCLGGGETAGNPGSCGTAPLAPPPQVLPAAPGAPGTRTGSAAAAAGTSSSSGASSTGGSAPAASGRNPARTGTKVAALGRRASGGSPATGSPTSPGGLLSSADLTVIDRGAQPGDRAHVGAAFPVVLVGAVIGPGGAVLGAVAATVALLCIWASRRRRGKGERGR